MKSSYHHVKIIFCCRNFSLLFLTSFKKSVVQLVIICLVMVMIDLSPTAGYNGRRHRNRNSNNNNDLSLWIDEDQVSRFSGYPMKIQAIADGHVLPYILDPNFQDYLPVIPSEVGVVNFTWKAGGRKYYYNFDRLQSFDEDVLRAPTITIPVRGEIPKKPQSFSVTLPCTGNPGIGSFTIGLLIETRKGKPLAGTPLRIRLKKECEDQKLIDSYSAIGNSAFGSSSRRETCQSKKCNGRCMNGICRCKQGYIGEDCSKALCYPKCQNNGTCSAPGVCSCLDGWNGLYCEGGICSEKCLNGGKCIQKDTCECSRGYYGLRCEYSKCMIPCLNGGKCRGVNTCRCMAGFSGEHCEIGTYARLTQRATCTLGCKNGNCVENNVCQCNEGWHGRRCSRKKYL